MINSLSIFIVGIISVFFGMLLLYIDIRLTSVITDKLFAKKDKK